MLNNLELTWLKTKYANRTKTVGSTVNVDDAHAAAIKWVNEHAAGMIPAVQHGICLACTRFALESDAGERQNLKTSIDALLMLGRNVRDARHE